MVEAMGKEIWMRKDFFSGAKELATVYLGGGTPSVLSHGELAQLLACIADHFPISPTAEITLEANPDDLSPEKLAELVSVGVNRLSIGIQSFRDLDMQWMNRSHTPEQSIDCIQNAHVAGIHNLSIDLIFGTPDMDREAWEANLTQALALAPQHISVYALAVTEKTALHNWVSKGKFHIPSDELAEAQFLTAHDLLTAAGYEHYELSSYALPGFRSRHNSAYWQQVPYLGIGPSAHSFDGQRRHWNVRNNALYLKGISEGGFPPFEREVLSLQDKHNEYLLTQLRRVEGIDLAYIEKAFDYSLLAEHADWLAQQVAAGRMWTHDGWVGFTPLGWLVSDQLIGELFW